MANTIWFVPHRYAAPPRSDFVPLHNLCLWNNSTKHHRKLIASHDATVVDGSGNAHLGQHITFVGEWECCSTYADNGAPTPFDRTHTPMRTLHDLNPRWINTDPYVFGREFYWSCCKHPKDRDRIQPGDIVLFGSYTLVNSKVDKMVLDTVLVVDRIFGLTEKQLLSFSQCYRDVTLSKLNIGCGAATYMVAGKMYDPARGYDDNEPFSFVPCRRQGLMAKLVLDIPAFEGTPLRFQQNGGHLVVDDAVAAFRQIVGTVRAAGCELGVFMPEPTQFVPNTICSQYAKKRSQKPQPGKCPGTQPGKRCDKKT